MRQLYWKKMAEKDLYIIQSTSIANNKAVCDGQVIYESDNDAVFPDFSKLLYKKLEINYPKFYKMDCQSKLAFLATEILVRRLKTGKVLPENTCLIFSNSASTLDTDKNFIATLESIPSPAVFVYTLPNIALGEMCIRHGWKGETMFLIQQQFDARQLIEQIRLSFSDTNISDCIVGWCNYSSDTNYNVHLWLVTSSNMSKILKLSEMQILHDFNLHS
jgi:hypothetical protein